MVSQAIHLPVSLAHSMSSAADWDHGPRRMATARPGQWLYLFADEGVLYSECLNRFIGLNAAGISAYRAFDAGASVEELNLLNHFAPPYETAGSLAAIHALSRGVFPPEDTPIAWPSLHQPSISNLEIGGIPTRVDFPSGPLQELCRDYFRNCPPASGPAKCHISAHRLQEGWTISINACAILSSLRDEQLGLGFLHAARSLLYAESNYDIAFHAAMVSTPEFGLLLAGPREAGKSTLAAYLIAHGFDLLSDEPALLDLDSGKVALLNLPISLKQGSWVVLGREWENAPLHVRSDGTKIRLLHSTPENRSSSRRLTHIIFPEFRPSGSAGADRLQPLQALNLLNEAGMVLAKDISRNQFEAFLKMICSTPAYTLRYSSLQEGALVIGDILGEDHDWQTSSGYAKL